MLGTLQLRSFVLSVLGYLCAASRSLFLDGKRPEKQEEEAPGMLPYTRERLLSGSAGPGKERQDVSHGSLVICQLVWSAYALIEVVFCCTRVTYPFVHV